MATTTDRPEVRPVKLSDLTFHPDLQVRTNQDDEYADYFARMVESVKAGQRRKGDPPVAFDDDQVLWPGDGFTWAAACREAGVAEMEYEVRKGSFNDAWLYARTEANRDHGRRYTTAEKKRRVCDILKHKDFENRSARDVAELCGVHHSTVSAYRDELIRTGGISQSGSERVVYTNPKTGRPTPMDVSKIKASNQKRKKRKKCMGQVEAAAHALQITVAEFDKLTQQAQFYPQPDGHQQEVIAKRVGIHESRVQRYFDWKRQGEESTPQEGQATGSGAEEVGSGPRDPNGWPLSPRSELVSVFEAANELGDDIRTIGRIRQKWLDRIASGHPATAYMHSDDIKNFGERFRGALKCPKPRSVCPDCKGSRQAKGKPCVRCSKSHHGGGPMGFITVAIYSGLLPAEKMELNRYRQGLAGDSEDDELTEDERKSKDVVLAQTLDATDAPGFVIGRASGLGVGKT